MGGGCPALDRARPSRNAVSSASGGPARGLRGYCGLDGSRLSWAGLHRDDGGEGSAAPDSCPVRRRVGDRADRLGEPSLRMTTLMWISLALGLGIVVARRRSMAIGLIGLQSAVVSATALALTPGRSIDFLGAAIVLVLKAVLITLLLWSAMRKTREAKPVRAGIDPLARLGLTLGAVLVVNFLVPPLSVVDVVAQQGSLA